MKLLPLIFYSTELANDESRYQGISGANYIFNNVAGSRNKYKIITSTATEQNGYLTVLNMLLMYDITANFI